MSYRLYWKAFDMRLFWGCCYKIVKLSFLRRLNKLVALTGALGLNSLLYNGNEGIFCINFDMNQLRTKHLVSRKTYILSLKKPTFLQPRNCFTYKLFYMTRHKLTIKL